jgi:tripartite-type tricarboxylate transporter receptor subunit TctC
MSAGVGAPSHLAVELLRNKTGNQHDSRALQGHRAGHRRSSGRAGAGEHTDDTGGTDAREGGRLRALATTGANRAPAAPELPTMMEAGIPDYEAANWFGIVVPAKTPPAIIARLNQDIVRALSVPDVREKMLTQGMEPVSRTPEAFLEVRTVRDRQVGGGRQDVGAKPE